LQAKKQKYRETVNRKEKFSYATRTPPIPIPNPVLQIKSPKNKVDTMNPGNEESRNEENEKYLPVLLNVTEKKILMIGAGNACREKLQSLRQIKKEITVIAPQIHEDFLNKSWVKIVQKNYEKSDLTGFDIAYVGVNDPELESRILIDAHHAGILLNFVDKKEFSDFISPSVLQKNHYSIFISTFGKGPGAARHIRQTIEKNIDLEELDHFTGNYIKNRNRKTI